jgi:hypothetical protein
LADAGWILLLGVAVVVAQAGPSVLTFLYPLPSVIIDLQRCYGPFGRTLARIAKRLSPVLRCTWHAAAGYRGIHAPRELAWCFFFAAMGAASILLFVHQLGDLVAVRQRAHYR